VSSSSFRSVERLSLGLCVLTYLLLVLGNLVRATDSGLAYLTWPLYNGRLIPDREFHVLMEFTHRAVAGTVTLVFLALAGLIAMRPETRARLGRLAALGAGLLLTQILLGALTVWKLLAPAFVVLHLGTALLFFGTTLCIHLLARAEVHGRDVPLSPTPAHLRLELMLAPLAVYGQMLLGGWVSSSHAGLACPDFPTCHGRWFPPLQGPEGIQMLHRYGAYALLAFLGLVAFHSGGAPQHAVRVGARVALALGLLQGVLGALNVLLGIPWWLTALHLATATAILAVCTATAARVVMAHPVAQSREILGVAS
jgi:cytochrome c oxidase assembly protein subunit 15